MSLLNEILSFFIKRRGERIQHFKENPEEVQLATFSSLLHKAKDTEWGRKYAYASISSYKEFKERVPVNSYETLFPYIERVLKGERNVLWPTPIEWFSKSSGTTNARSKYIPVSEESLDMCHYMGGKDLLCLYLEGNEASNLFDGKGLSIGGALHNNPYNSTTKVGDISAIIMQNLPPWAEYLRTPPLHVALLDDWELKLKKMIELCPQENITSILGVPTWTVVLLEKIKELHGVTSLLELWPNFELFVHGAVNFDPFRNLFKTAFFPAQQVKYMETYNASEGYFGIQDDLSLEGQMLLMLDYGVFFEFAPMEDAHKEFPNSVSLEEVELYKNYAILISTNAGLWRYRIGDTIRFTSKRPFRFKISGRTKHFINAFGEELIIENADIAISTACKACGIHMREYTAAPIFMDETGQGSHEWIVECSPFPLQEMQFVETLDNTLRELNSDYHAKREKGMALRFPTVHFVQEGTFYKWMERRGKLGGQNKVPRLSNNREYVDEILSYIRQNTIL